MGEIRVKVRLENNNDLALYEAGIIKKNKVRSAEIDVLVDTGAVELLLPQDLVEKLGLKLRKKVTVTLADDRKIELWLAGTILLSIGDRNMSSDCLVGPPKCEPIVGQIVLEALDLVLNPRKKTITPNPTSPYLPNLKMKQTTIKVVK
jgi:clan AA aspartic protease